MCLNKKVMKSIVAIASVCRTFFCGWLMLMMYGKWWLLFYM